MKTLYDSMDSLVAEELKIDINTYIRIIECECTEDEAEFIIMTIIEGDSANFQKAKDAFYQYL
jgi:hypothetical protein